MRASLYVRLRCGVLRRVRPLQMAMSNSSRMLTNDTIA